MKKLTKKQAIEVAREEYGVGVLDAVALLKEMGFNTSTFDYYINSFDEEELEEYNNEIILEARDLLFKNLGIEDLMEDAYDTITNESVYQVTEWNI